MSAKMTDRGLDAAVARALGIELRAKTPERVARAVFSGLRVSHGNSTATVEWDGETFGPIRMLGCFNDGAPGNDAYGLAWWNARAEHPWHGAIERHVAKWSEIAEPYSTDGSAMLALLGALRERGWGWRIDNEPNRDYVAVQVRAYEPSGYPNLFDGKAPTLPRAVAEAALAALGGE